MTLVKLCGMISPRDIEVINELEPRYTGFIFAKKSSRYIDPEDAGKLIAKLRPEIVPVGVFLNADLEYIRDCCLTSDVRAVQIHGDYDNDYIRDVRRTTGLPVIQAFKVSDEKDIERARRSEADLVLLDNGYGGTGESFNWSLLEGMNRNYMLAGGLTPANVKNAITYAHPYAVDVSSGIETDGLKDPAKMTAFVGAVRDADSQ